MKKKLLIPFAVITGFLAYYLIWHAPIQRSCSFYSMGGILTEIKGYATNKKTMDAASKQIRGFFEDMENEISIYRNDSYISKINMQQDKVAVRLPEHTYNMVKESLRISENTLGYYDITVLPVLDLWKKAQQQNVLPTAGEQKRALEKVSYKKLILDEKTHSLTFTARGMELDLGAIAKGYMGDETRRIMEKLGIRRGLINCGGGIVVYDHSPHPEPFTIKVFNPDEDTVNKGKGGIIGQGVILMTNGSVQTSGDYNRYYTINDRRYSHIVDPHNGSASGGCHSVTVKSTVEGRSGAIADAYGTGFCSMVAAGKNPVDLHIGEVEIIQLKK
jgi:thiamine biosynthesis lipoprotein